MKYYHICTDPHFGSGANNWNSYKWASGLKPGDEVKNLFGTPHWECVDNIFAKACYYAFLSSGGFPWAWVLEIEAEPGNYRKPIQGVEKEGHDDDFDQDEVYILKGTVLRSYKYLDVVETTDEWHRTVFRKYW